MIRMNRFRAVSMIEQAGALASDRLKAPHAFLTRDARPKNPALIEAKWVRLRQIHSARVVMVAEQWPWGAADPPKADALVTQRTDLALAIVTADCAPVLLADVRAGVVGAAHAGWRGAQGGVLENTLAAMEALGARRERIAAAIGPTIAQPSYEVDAGFRTHFNAADERFFVPNRPGHWQFDLPGYVAARLEQAGISQIDDLALDTFGDCARFYSYRRATQLGEPDDGRQISVIAVPTAPQ